MKKMITTTTKDTHKRLSTNSGNGSFQNRPRLILTSFMSFIKSSSPIPWRCHCLAATRKQSYITPFIPSGVLTLSTITTYSPLLVGNVIWISFPTYFFCISFLELSEESLNKSNNHIFQILLRSYSIMYSPAGCGHTTKCNHWIHSCQRIFVTSKDESELFSIA